MALFPNEVTFTDTRGKEFNMNFVSLEGHDSTHSRWGGSTGRGSRGMERRVGFHRQPVPGLGRLRTDRRGTDWRRGCLQGPLSSSSLWKMSPRLERWVWPRDLGLGVSNSHLCPWGSEYQWPATDNSSSLSPYWQCRCCYSYCLLALNDSVGYVTSVTSVDTLSTARPWVLETKTAFSTLLRLLLCQENPQKNSYFLFDWRKDFCSAPERTWR